MNGDRYENPRTGAERYFAKRMADPLYRSRWRIERQRIDQFDSVITRLEDRRRQVGLSKAELARLSGLGVRTVQRLFQPGASNPPLANLVAVAEAMGMAITVEYEDGDYEVTGSTGSMWLVHGARLFNWPPPPPPVSQIAAWLGASYVSRTIPRGVTPTGQATAVDDEPAPNLHPTFETIPDIWWCEAHKAVGGADSVCDEFTIADVPCRLVQLYIRTEDIA